MSIEFNTANGISATGSISSVNFLIGDGSYLSNINAVNVNLLNLQSNVIPASNVTYTLGNANSQWLSASIANSLFINSVALSVTGNILTVVGDPVLLASNTAPYAQANIATTANVVAGNVVIMASGNVVFPDATIQSTGYSNAILANYLPGANTSFNSVGNIALTGNLSVGGDLSTTGNITALGNLYANNLSSNNVVTGTLTTAYQPNITSVGNLVSVSVAGGTSAANLTVSGNAIVGNIQAIGNVQIPPGNVSIVYGNASELFGDAYGFGALYAGINANVPIFANTVAQFTAEYTDYTAVNFQNLNSGPHATTDWILTADNGTDTTYYVDMGIASSTFDGTSANALGNVINANDGYLYIAGGAANAPGGNLNIAAVTSNRTVNFIAGPGDSANIVLSVAGPNVSALGNVSATFLLGDASNVTGVGFGNIVYNGVSNVTIPVADGNININYNGSNAGLLAPYALTLGVGAGVSSTGNLDVAIGYNAAGDGTQGVNSVAVGLNAGQTAQGANSVAVGVGAGSTNQSANAVAIGQNAGANAQSTWAIALGSGAGANTQGQGAVAIGINSGTSTQGANSIVIGGQAGITNMPAGGISINSSGLTTTPGAAGFNVVPVRQQPGSASVYQSLAYNPATKALTRWYPNNYNNFVYATAGLNLTIAQAGASIQLAGTTILPYANSVPVGTKYNFYANTSQVVALNIPSGNFIYTGFRNLTGFIQLYTGESLEVTSRGPGTNEWDITGGTAVLKYLATNNNNYNTGATWRIGLNPNTNWGTTLTLDTWTSSGVQQISAQMGTDGYLYIASPSGTITVDCSVLQLCSGHSIAANNFQAFSVGAGFVKLNTQFTQGTPGDVFECNLNDETNNRVYRITAIKNNNSPAKGSLVIERLN